MILSGFDYHNFVYFSRRNPQSQYSPTLNQQNKLDWWWSRERLSLANKFCLSPKFYDSMKNINLIKLMMFLLDQI